MKLYHCPPTRSQRALWALTEAGVDFEAVHINLFEGEQNSDAYRAIQSRGVVPALETDEGVIVESAAITMLAFEQCADGSLAPAPGSPDRGAYLQWCVFGPAELDHYLVTVTQNVMLLPEDKRDPDKVIAAKEQLALRWDFLAAGVDGREFLVGDSFSGADVSVGHSCQWARMVGALSDHPRVEAYLDGLSKRPAFQKVYGS